MKAISEDAQVHISVAFLIKAMLAVGVVTGSWYQAQMKFQEISIRLNDIEDRVTVLATDVAGMKQEHLNELEEEVKEQRSLLQTMIAGGMGLSSLIGMWFALQADIQEAKELPVPVSLFSQEYPSKGISDFNWSPSYEQYKQQVGNLGENQDEIYEMVEELQEEIEKLKQQVINLRIAVQ